MIGIYKITNPKGESYIGQSTNIKNRFASHKYAFKKGKNKWGKLTVSFKKHGIENHSFEILETCEKHILNEKELFWQKKYDSIKNGLNCVLNKEKGKNKYSKESRLLMSKKAKIKVFTDTHRKNMSKNRQGSLNGNSKIILDFDTGVYYTTMKEAEKVFNISHGKMSSMLNGKIKNNTNLKFV
jgi:group I intron endonuclease